MTKSEAITVCKSLLGVGYYARPIKPFYAWMPWDVAINTNFRAVDYDKIQTALGLTFLDCLIPSIGNDDYPVLGK